MGENILYINTDECKRPKMQDSLLASRIEIAEAHRPQTAAEVTVVVVAYNRVEKTKRCVESILKYTKEIDYNLILIDNGSEDDTLEYYQSVLFEKKKIIKISKNIGGMMPFTYIDFQDIGEYMVFIANDLVMTANWLKNLLICAKSDRSTGMVAPLASNCSNFQGYNLGFASEKEMQEKAAMFNQSEPKKWQERLRLITLAPLFKKETLFAIGFPLFDPAFFHDFADDDVTFRVRRMGYKAILAGDTWIHHDHCFQIGEDKDIEEFQKSLITGRHAFREKWNGIDAWDDVNNFYFDVLPYISPPKIKTPKILGIDIRSGTPALDMKNHLKNYEIWNAEISAFTQQERYVEDLHTISSGIVACDREEFIRDYFPENFFHYVVIGKPINQYHEPQKVMRDVFSMTESGGLIILTLLNSFGVREFLNMLGKRNSYNPQISLNIPLEVLYKELQITGEVKFCHPRRAGVSQEDMNTLKTLLSGCTGGEAEMEICLSRLVTSEFVIGVEKK